MHFYEDPFEWRRGVKIVRGTSLEWPENAEYESKLVALREPRHIFDRLREAFFLPDRSRAKIVAEAIYELADQQPDAESFKVVADFILSSFLETETPEITWPSDLQNIALEVYLRTVSTKPYYFSVGELNQKRAPNIMRVEREEHS